MKGMVRMLYLCSIFIIAGCSARSNISSDQAWSEDRDMTRLEKDVQEQCDDLVRGIKPGSVFITWYDNLHPNTPMLSEAYIVSMFERGFIRRGFPISTSEKDASYKLLLTMTPSRKSMLALASLWLGDRIVATKEAHFIHGPEKWSKALCSYRFRTKTTIHIGSTP